MSTQSKYSLGMLVLLLSTTFMIMPYLVSDLAPSAGITIREITWGLGIANLISAISLYLRPKIKRTKYLILFNITIFLVSTVSLNIGEHYKFPLAFLLGVILLRSVLVNFSDINRQIHMSTNSDHGIKHALASANILSNVISCTIPIIASVLIIHYGSSFLITTSVFLSLCLFIPFIFLSQKMNTFNEVNLNTRLYSEGFIIRFIKNKGLYLITMINSIIFAFIFSYIPLLISHYPQQSNFNYKFLIGFYFTVDSVIISLLSIPLLKLIDKLEIKNLSILYLGSTLSILSIIVLIFYSGQMSILALSATFMAIAEILFIPFLIAYINENHFHHREIILKDITLISVSLSAVLSAPLADLLYSSNILGGVFFCSISSLILFLSLSNLRKINHE